MNGESGRPGGWVPGIGFVTLFGHLRPGEQVDHKLPPLDQPVIVTRWASGEVPTAPDERADGLAPPERGWEIHEPDDAFCVRCDGYGVVLPTDESTAAVCSVCNGITADRPERGPARPSPVAESGCPFCEIIAGDAPAKVLREWPDAICIVPLNPVVPGHRLVIPREHVRSFFVSPEVSAAVMRRAAECVHGVERWVDPYDYNIITSVGPAATQTIEHLHVHLVPRKHGDGLKLPWSPSPVAEQPEPERVRVVVVYDHRRHSVHQITSDNDEAVSTAKQLAAKYGGDPLSVSMTAGVVDLPAPPSPLVEPGPTSTPNGAL